MALPAHMALHLVLLEALPVALLLAAGRDRIARMPVRPLLAGVASTVIIVVWHLPLAFDAAVGNPLLHQAEHLSFVVAGLLLWAPVLSPATGAAEALAFLFVTRNVQAALGNVLLWAPHPLYRDSGSLHDQRLAGAIMLGEGLLTGIVAAGWLFSRLLHEERRRGAAAAAQNARRTAEGCGRRLARDQLSRPT
jgi:cytochrome c oxidase assembly factor CtaG